eukprot:763620-Hanusia_phi.AAC.3
MKCSNKSELSTGQWAMRRCRTLSYCDNAVFQEAHNLTQTVIDRGRRRRPAQPVTPGRGQAPGAGLSSSLPGHSGHCDGDLGSSRAAH